MEAVYILGEIIEIGRREGCDYKLGFLDIRKAYDMRDVLWDQLREAGYWGGGGGFLD